MQTILPRTFGSLGSRRLGLLAAAVLVPTISHALAAPWDELKERSVSRSHQFIVYAADQNARAAIAMDADDVKVKFLQLLQVKDEWKRPIVIDLKTADPANPNQAPSDVRIFNSDEGFKVQLDVVLGPDPREAHFPQQLIRSLLLEYAYRNQPSLVRASVPYAEPPPWLIDGLASLAADPDPDTGSALFQGLIQSGKTPTLSLFLSENPATLDTPSRRLYSACSMSLVRLLLGMSNGSVEMQNFIRHWPGGSADPEAELLKAFPGLDSGHQSLEKWWSIGLAAQSAADRYQGLSLADTSQQIDNALKFDVAMDKAGSTKKSFTLDQYASFKSAPGATAALNNLSERLVALETRANPLMREIVAGYEELSVRLAHHEAHHLQARLDNLADYRKQLLDHMDKIADYLNWYEATQRTQASGSFDEYIRTADQIDKQTAPERHDPISKYMDGVEQEFAQ